MTEAFAPLGDDSAGVLFARAMGFAAGARGRHEGRRPRRDRADLGGLEAQGRRGTRRLPGRHLARPRPRRAASTTTARSTRRSSTRRRSARWSIEPESWDAQAGARSGRPATLRTGPARRCRPARSPPTARWSRSPRLMVNERIAPARLPERHAGRPGTTAATGSAWRSSSPTTARLREALPRAADPAHRQRRRERPDERRQRRARLPRGRALRRDAEGPSRSRWHGSLTRCDPPPTPARDGRLARDATTPPTCSGRTTRRRGCWRRCAREFLGERTGERVEPLRRVRRRAAASSTGFVELPQMDNRHLARVDVATHPDHRGRGHGSALLEHLTAVAVAQGRSTLNADAAWAYDAPAGRRGHARRGLPDPARLRVLPRRREAGPGPARRRRAARRGWPPRRRPGTRGYTLRDFVGPVPEDLLDEFGDAGRVADHRGADGRPGRRAGGVRRRPDPRRREGLRGVRPDEVHDGRGRPGR